MNELQRRQWHPTPVLLPGKSHGQYWILGAGALGQPRGMVRGGRREKGSGYAALITNEIMCRRPKISGEGKICSHRIHVLIHLPQDLAPKQEVKKYLENT